MELLRKMLEVTMTRGAQSAGLVTYRQDGGDAQGCRARTVSGKRTDLARLVLSNCQQTCWGQVDWKGYSKRTVDGLHRRATQKVYAEG